MSKRMDYGTPGDPSGCYFPKEWRTGASDRRGGDEGSQSRSAPKTPDTKEGGAS